MLGSTEVWTAGGCRPRSRGWARRCAGVGRVPRGYVGGRDSLAGARRRPAGPTSPARPGRPDPPLSSPSAQDMATARSSRSSGRSMTARTAWDRRRRRTACPAVQPRPHRGGTGAARYGALAARMSCRTDASAGSRPSRRIRASRSGRAGSGSRSVVARQPSAARPRRGQVQRATAETDRAQPSVSVTASCAPAIGPSLQCVRREHEPPRLRVVHRGRPHRERNGPLDLLDRRPGGLPTSVPSVIRSPVPAEDDLEGAGVGGAGRTRRRPA